MSGVTLNDVVVEWGSHNGANAYNPAKDRLTAGMTQEEVAAFAGATNWNDGLRYLAQGPPVLQEAVLLLDASFSDAGEPRVINRGTGGSALNAKYGSVLGAYVYDGAAVLPGIANNYLSTPDAAALDITGDIEIVARIRLNDYTSSSQALVAKQQTGSTRSYYLDIDASGRLVFFYSANGTTQLGGTASSAPGFVDGAAYWVKLTRNAATGSYSYYKSDDQELEPSTWTLISTVAGASGAMFSSTSQVELGGRGGGTFGSASGSIYRTIVRDGIDGTTVLDVDLTAVADYATSFTATTGQTVTVNSTSSDTNDPLLLTHTGENYVCLPGAGSFLTVPDSAALDITGDIEIVVRAQAVQWGSGVAASLVAKWQTQTAYMLRVAASGVLEFYWSPDGVSIPVLQSTVTVQSVIPDNTTAWLKVTFDADNGAGGRTASFFYSLSDSNTEPTVWTPLGVPVTSAGATSIFNSTSTLAIGAAAAGSWPFVGNLYRAIVRNGIGGTVAFNLNTATDITDGAATSFAAASGQTVTVLRPTSGRKTALVTRPIWLFGTDDYLEVADNALLDFGAAEDFTMMLVHRRFATTAASTGSMSKATSSISTGGGYRFMNTSASGARFDVGIAGGANTLLGYSQPAAGVLGGLFGVRDSGTILTSMNGTETSGADGTTAGSIANASPLRIGSYSDASGWDAFEVVAAAVWRRALTTDEIAAINQYYGTA